MEFPGNKDFYSAVLGIHLQKNECVIFWCFAIVNYYCVNESTDSGAM